MTFSPFSCSGLRSHLGTKYSSHYGAKLSGLLTLRMTPELTQSLSPKERNVITACPRLRVNLLNSAGLIFQETVFSSTRTGTFELQAVRAGKLFFSLILCNKRKSLQKHEESWSSRTEAADKCTHNQFIATRPADITGELQRSPWHIDTAPPLVTASQRGPIRRQETPISIFVF